MKGVHDLLAIRLRPKSWDAAGEGELAQILPTKHIEGKTWMEGEEDAGGRDEEGWGVIVQHDDGVSVLNESVAGWGRWVS